jgi:predicted XRE-type DNA-binding protein
MKKHKNAFELIESNPVKLKVMALKNDLMNEVIDLIRHKIDYCNYTQTDVAVMLGVTQPRISKLLNGNFSDFSIDMLTQFKFGLE